MAAESGKRPENVPWARYRTLRRGLIVAIATAVVLGVSLAGVTIYYVVEEVHVTAINWLPGVPRSALSSESSCDGPGLNLVDTTSTTGGNYPYGSKITELFEAENLNLSQSCSLSNLTVFTCAPACPGPAVSALSSDLPATVTPRGSFAIQVTFALPSTSNDMSINIAYEAVQAD